MQALDFIVFGHKLILHICSRNVRSLIQKLIFNFGGNHFHCKRGGWLGASSFQQGLAPPSASRLPGTPKHFSHGAETGLTSPKFYLRLLLNNALYFTNGNSQFTAVSIIWEFCDTCLVVLLHVLLFFSWDKPGFLPIFSLLPAAGPSHWRKSWWEV